VRRSLLSALALAVLLPAIPAVAGAQFTSFVAPPRPLVDSAQPARTIAAADSARRAQRDSAERLAITNMKQWVDSAAVAAGTRIPPTAATEPTRPGTTATAPTSARSDGGVPTFRDGSPAPQTATPFPLLALAGLGSTAAGLVLLRRRS
jgi:hypothetical protein